MKMTSNYNGSLLLSTLLQMSFAKPHVSQTKMLATGNINDGPWHSESSRLFEHLFADGRYHAQLRPVKLRNKPLNVSIQMWFKQVLKMDEVDQVVTLYVWLEQVWKDEFLRWNPEDFGGLRQLTVPVSMIWQPDILVYNNANMHVKDNEHSTNIHISHTGKMMLFRSIITDIACQLDMAYFPFDQQACYVMFASWSYDGSKLLVTTPEDHKDNLQFYIENSEWTLIDFKHIINLKYYDCCPAPYSDIAYHFILERNPSYYILSLIIPSAFITVVTIVGFFVPHSSSGENTEKVSLGVTALLSLAIILLMVADKMPATSKVIPLIGIYYIGLIFVIFIATCMSTLTLNIQLRGNAGKPIPPYIRRFFFEVVAKYLFMNINVPDFHSTTQTLPENSNNSASVWRKMDRIWTVTDTMMAEVTGRRGFQNKFFQYYDMMKSYNISPILQHYILSSAVHPRISPAPRRPVGSTPTPAEALLETILEALNDIKQDIRERMYLEVMKREWEQLARVCERLLMLAFIALTVLFPAILLSLRGDPIVLTDKLMSDATID